MQLSTAILALALVSSACNFAPQAAGGGDENDGSVDRDAEPNPSDGSPVDGSLPDATPLEMIDRGLVVRYFLDDAASGQDVTELADSAPNPLSLPVTYAAGMEFVDDGNRGLRWTTAGGAGRAQIGLGGTKILSALSGSVTGTIEVVVDVDTPGTPLGPSYISHVGGGNPDFTIVAYTPNNIRFHSVGGQEAGTWSVNPQPAERMVLHVVLDTGQSDSDDRVTLYKNGVFVAEDEGAPPSQNQPLGLLGSDEYTLGNRQQNDRSFAGTLYYSALYSSALSADEVTNNAMRLLATDDR